METSRKLRTGSMLLLFSLASGAVAVSEACGGSSDVGIDVLSDAGNPTSTVIASGTSGGTSSGSPVTGGDTGAPDGRAPDAGAPDAASPIGCPPGVPTQGGACPSSATECTYGENPRFSCHTSAVCKGGGWLITTPLCTVTAKCPDAPSPDAGCTTGEVCGYAATTCVCFGCSGLCTVPPPPTVYHCSAPPAGCPTTPPNIGTACGSVDVSCNYGSCNGGVAVRCVDGAWKRVFTACPG